MKNKKLLIPILSIVFLLIVVLYAYPELVKKTGLNEKHLDSLNLFFENVSDGKDYDFKMDLEITDKGSVKINNSDKFESSLHSLKYLEAFDFPEVKYANTQNFADIMYSIDDEINSYQGLFSRDRDRTSSFYNSSVDDELMLGDKELDVSFGYDGYEYSLDFYFDIDNNHAINFIKDYLNVPQVNGFIKDIENEILSDDVDEYDYFKNSKINIRKGMFGKINLRLTSNKKSNDRIIYFIKEFSKNIYELDLETIESRQDFYDKLSYLNRYSYFSYNTFLGDYISLNLFVAEDEYRQHVTYKFREGFDTKDFNQFIDYIKSMYLVDGQDILIINDEEFAFYLNNEVYSMEIKTDYSQEVEVTYYKDGKFEFKQP